MASPSISISDEMLERIDSARDATTSRSEWFRNAADEKLSDTEDDEMGAA